MKLIKKQSTFIILILLIIAILSACNFNNNFLNKDTLKAGVLKGPTALGFSKLMDNNEDNKSNNKYDFTVAGDPSELASKLSSGDLDIACLPTNAAANLYNKTNGNVQIISLTTLGMLYIVTYGKSDIKSIGDLKGKTIRATGKGAAPEYALNYILNQNGIIPGKDVKIEYESEHSILASKVISDKLSVSMLPEPFVTQLLNIDVNVNVCLNLTDEWEKISNGSVLTMGCLAVKKDFVNSHKNAVDFFVEDYKNSASYINGNIDEASKLSEKFNFMKSNIAKQAIPRCNIVAVDGHDMVVKTTGFLEVLYNSNPQSIGGRMPLEDFYYKK